MKESFKSALAEIDRLIRDAHGLEAQRMLASLKAQGIPSEELANVARLSTRAGIADMAIALLHPIVRPSAKLIRKATPADFAEYGVALLKVGAVAEARDLLKRISPDEFPEALLYRAITHLRAWEYTQASPLLRQYVSLSSLTPYQRLIGKINLAISLILDESRDEIETLLQECLEECSVNKHALLFALCTREMGNFHLLKNDLGKASEYFLKAEKLLTTFGGNELHYARKWIALLRLKQEPHNPEYRNALEAVKNEAKALKNWESLRNIDYHLALYTHDESLMQYLYFGTPYAEFRKRLVVSFAQEKLPENFIWKHGTGPVFDLSRQKPLPNGEFLKVGQSLHRMYECLISDFYRPQELAALFERVFPGEYYTPTSSGHRVHQCLKNLRQWFKENQIPLDIVHEDGAYRLEATKPCGILIVGTPEVQPAETARIGILHGQLEGEFTAKQVCDILKLEISSVQSLLKDAVENGRAERIGAGRSTRYRLLSAKGSLKAPPITRKKAA